MVAALIPARARADESEDLAFTRANYTKYEYRVPMRDGTKLFTQVYAPKDHSVAYPILFMRTPYSVSPYGSDNYRATLGPSDAFEKEEFIFVYQDVRGRSASEGTFVDVPIIKDQLSGPKDTDESSDAFDSIDWLLKNVPNNNGRVGMWGVSYPGFYAACALVRSHPALKAVSPQAPIGDVGNGDDAYHNGAFFLAANFGFYTGFKPRGPELTQPRDEPPFNYGMDDQYEFYLQMGPLANADKLYFHGANRYWTDILEHPNYDEFWASRALAPRMRHVNPAVMFVGGWFDSEDLAGPLKLFRAVDANGGAPADSLVMGPWRHGGWRGADGETLGALNFASKTAEFFRNKIELPFFVQILKDKNSASNLPKAYLFATGVNEWRQFNSWPPREGKMRSLYLQAGGALSFSQPAGSQSFDSYVSDPAKPVPVTDEIGEGMPGDYMARDQRFAARRTDVLTYQTEPLENDITVAGPITASLRVSTSGTDSDFIVKVVDVYPNDYGSKGHGQADRMGGFEQLVRGEPFRGKFRHSLAHPEAFTPGQPDRLEFAMPDVLHTFRAGHRIMVQIQSSWFPMVDRNPQKFVDIPQAAASDFQKAEERVYCGGTDGSRINFTTIGQY